MKIKKILNNNAVISVNEKNQEVIITGLGIAFKKKTGEDIDDSKIERVFKSYENKNSEKIQKIIETIQPKFLEISEQILQNASDVLKVKLNDNSLFALADHISFAVERLEQGIDIKNPLLWEIKQYYNAEYQIGLSALAIIEDKAFVKLPEEEAGSIALHIVNAEANRGITQTFKSVNLLQDLISIIKYHFLIEFDETSVSYQRMINHLKFFAKTVTNDEKKYESNIELYEIIKYKYQNSFKCARKIKTYLNDSYGYNVCDEDMIFLIVHIERCVNGK